MRPVSVDIWSWSDRNRCPALTMLSSSLPTLNAMTARTFREIPCRVTQVSETSASVMDSVRNFTLRTNGGMKAPCPVTTLNGAPLRPYLPPETSIASSGRGTRYPNIFHLLNRLPCRPLFRGPALLFCEPPNALSAIITQLIERVAGPLHHVESPRPPCFDNEHGGPCGSGSSDQAMKDSEPPRILIRTSPGPRSPRVPTVRTPTEPIADESATNACPLTPPGYVQTSPATAVV